MKEIITPEIIKVLRKELKRYKIFVEDEMNDDFYPNIASIELFIDFLKMEAEKNVSNRRNKK